MPSFVINVHEPEYRVFDERRFSTLDIAVMIADAAKERLGIVMSDEHLMLSARFIDGLRARKETENYREWLMPIMFGRLTLPQQAYIVSLVEEPIEAPTQD